MSSIEKGRFRYAILKKLYFVMFCYKLLRNYKQRSFLCLKPSSIQHLAMHVLQSAGRFQYTHQICGLGCTKKQNSNRKSNLAKEGIKREESFPYTAFATLHDVVVVIHVCMYVYMYSLYVST